MNTLSLELLAEFKKALDLVDVQGTRAPSLNPNAASTSAKMPICAPRDVLELKHSPCWLVERNGKRECRHSTINVLRLLIFGEFVRFRQQSSE
jgi:hypothetical protein